MTFTREEFEADAERYRREIAEAIEAGFAENHPLVVTPRRRLDTVTRTLADPLRCRMLGIAPPPEVP